MNKSKKLDFSLLEILDLLPGNVYWKDKDGVFIGCNQRLLKERNIRSLSDYKGKTYDDLYEGDYIQQIKETDRQVMREDRTITLEEEAIGIDGKEKHYLTTKCPLHGKDGSIIGLLGISIDITERRVAQAELASAKERIQSMRLVGASIAHELRTPLRSIKLFAQGLKDYLPALTQAYKAAKQHNLDIPFIRNEHLTILEHGVDSINLQVDHATLFINMLLNNLSFKKINKEQFIPYAICSCINMALSAYPFAEKERDLIDLQCKADFTFSGSKVLIVQVLFNLIKNAMYFIAAAGRGNIRIWTETGKQYNYLYFEDTAQGIPEDILDNIFDKFFTKHTAHGTGIGLAFCKMCMQEHGGDIICESKYGQYARFILSFPVEIP